MQVTRTFAAATAAAVVISMGAAGAMMFATPAIATPQFAKDTGKSCAACHTNPQGGGALTPLGTKFKANGNKMPAAP
jgi:mono/diheme cytochrome c family protein